MGFFQNLRDNRELERRIKFLTEKLDDKDRAERNLVWQRDLESERYTKRAELLRESIETDYENKIRDLKNKNSNEVERVRREINQTWEGLEADLLNEISSHKETIATLTEKANRNLDLVTELKNERDALRSTVSDLVAALKEVGVKTTNVTNNVSKG